MLTLSFIAMMAVFSMLLSSSTTLAFTCRGFYSFTSRRRLSSYSLVFSRTILDPPCSNTNTNNNINNDGNDWQYVLHLAEDAARRAGEIMKRTTGRISSLTTKSNVRDLVTESDVACQQVIFSTINAVRPYDVFLGEENVASGSLASIQALQEVLSIQQGDDDGEEYNRLLWIVDPIDGTTNFQAGLPLFCASIGVIAWNQTTQEPEIQVGVIYNPILDEMTSAVAGRGAYLNGKRLHVPETTTTTTTTIPLNECLVNVGFPVMKESTLQASSKAVAALANKVRGLRMIACASQVITWVARNQFQSYLSWDLNAWDVCAGMLVTRESGGCVLDFASGQEATIESRDLIFTSPSTGRLLADEIRQVLEDNDCLEY